MEQITCCLEKDICWDWNSDRHTNNTFYAVNLYPNVPVIIVCELLNRVSLLGGKYSNTDKSTYLHDYTCTLNSPGAWLVIRLHISLHSIFYHTAHGLGHHICTPVSVEKCTFSICYFEGKKWGADDLECSILTIYKNKKKIINLKADEHGASFAWSFLSI